MQVEGCMDMLEPTATSAAGDTPVPSPVPGVLHPGTTFGGYRLGRVLGRGGMGVVYEAEEIASGRRIALKALQRRHGDEYDRERFEREGRLAASIDHEHCVYVFGAEEIDGVPASAMVLMQGTLADRLTDGPMPPAAAVDAALQLIDGLRAAQDAGVLHRDVKPSNCFVDADGVVKIGDFGNSRSLRPADETTKLTRTRFAATPTYASPEQLSGKALDVRADIYSLGATLYELLTGERPFAQPDLMSLLMAVANEMPRAPHEVAPAVPKGLSRIVLRCLAKRPEDRFRTYEALAAALEPYASWSPTPATLGRRFTAGIIDLAVLSLASTPFQWWLGLTNLGIFEPRVFFAVVAGTTVLQLAYYGFCESLWGATAGKALAGVTVVGADRQRPRPAVAFRRVVVFLAPGLLANVVEMFRSGGTLDTTPGAMALSILLWLLLLAAQFSTARRHNGYAALHDLATGTRVVARSARTAARPGRRQIAALPSRPAALDAQPTRGGFVILPGAIDGRPGWHVGYDPRLGRPVWIRDVVPGTPAIDASRAALSRHTRLRWLAGRRAEDEAWDVFEAVAGRPLSRALDDAWTWSMARQWLVDMTRELAAQRTEVPPPLDVERVWVLDTGRAKLLDDPATDRPDAPRPDSRRFLEDLARRLRRTGAPWPLSAERALREATTAPLDETRARLESQLRDRPTITRTWRLAALSPVVLPPLLVAGFVASVTSIRVGREQSAPPELRVPIAVVRTLAFDTPRTLNGTARAWGFVASGGRELTAAEREAFETYLTYRHQAALRDERLFDPAYNPLSDDGARRIVARLRERPAVDLRAGQAAAAHPRVQRLVRNVDVNVVSFTFRVGLAILAVMLTLAAIGGLLLAGACRGGVLRLFGFEIVTADGEPASRLRVLARGAAAWGPLFVASGAAYSMLPLSSVGRALILGTGVIVLCAGAVYAVVNPMRGIQDRLAGTWIVPR
jgi:uncharacterized RDD family membrane protein YckC